MRKKFEIFSVWNYMVLLQNGNYYLLPAIDEADARRSAMYYGNNFKGLKLIPEDIVSVERTPEFPLGEFAFYDKEEDCITHCKIE